MISIYLECQKLIKKHKSKLKLEVLYHGVFKEEELVLRDGDIELVRLPAYKSDYMLRDIKNLLKGDGDE